jgi:hypothetical protein
MSIFTDIKTSKLGSPLHGFRALWEGMKALSPEYQTYKQILNTRDFVRGDKDFKEFLKSGKSDYEMALKHNWPVILGSLAFMGGGAAGGGAGGASGGGGAFGGIFENPFGGLFGGGAGGGAGQAGAPSVPGATPGINPQAGGQFSQNNMLLNAMMNQQDFGQGVARQRNIQETNQLIAMVLANSARRQQEQMQQEQMRLQQMQMQQLQRMGTGQGQV